MNQKTLTYSAAGLAVVAALGYGIWSLKKRAGGSSPTGGADSVDVGRYFDWQLGTGKAADAARDLVSVPLVEVLGEDRVVPKLLKDMTFKDGVAAVTTKENVFWSDGRGFEAKDVADAWDRARAAQGAGTLPAPTAEESAWLEVVKVDVPGRYELRIGPLKDEAALRKFLGDRLLRPVRADLLGDKGSDDAFKVTLGPYRPEAVATTFPQGSDVKFVGNSYYYQRPVTDAKAVKVNALMNGTGI